LVERRHETKPPEIKNALLQPWIEMTQGPAEEPKLKDTTDGASLIASGTHRSSLKSSFTLSHILLGVLVGGSSLKPEP